jgi:hypothetical protein
MAAVPQPSDFSYALADGEIASLVSGMGDHLVYTPRLNSGKP